MLCKYYVGNTFPSTGLKKPGHFPFLSKSGLDNMFQDLTWVLAIVPYTFKNRVFGKM